MIFTRSRPPAMRRGQVRVRRPSLVNVVTLVLAVANGPAALASASWIPAWSASPSDAGGPVLAAQAVRQVIAPHAEGPRLRVRFTHRFGTAPVRFASAFVGRQASGAAVEPGTNVRLRFDGADSVTLPAGGEVLSDPVDFAVEPFVRLSISVQIDGIAESPTRHLTAIETLYLSRPGDHAGDESGDAFLARSEPSLTSWLFLAAVEVEVAGPPPVVVAFGDSITDGFVSALGIPVFEDRESLGLDARYPDFLQRRLLARPERPRAVVVNAGISGNRLLEDGAIFGRSGTSRLDEDLLAFPGVTDVILLEGINDLGAGPALEAQALIDGLAALVSRLQSRGIFVTVGTLLPARGTWAGAVGAPGNPASAGALHGSAETEAKRQVVNDWIRTSGAPDAVVDFDACLRDPANPAHLLPAFDSGDHLHPSPEGYAAMAECIDLDALRLDGGGRDAGTRVPS